MKDVSNAKASLCEMVPKQFPGQFQASADYLDAILTTVREPFLVLNQDLRIQTANQSFYKNFRVLPEETENRLLYQVGNGQWNIPGLQTLLKIELPVRNWIEGFEIEHTFPDGGQRTMRINARRLTGKNAQNGLILLSIEDISEYRRTEQQQRLATILAQEEIQKLNAKLHESRQCYRHFVQNLPAAVYACDTRGRVTLYNSAAADLWDREPEIGKDFWYVSWRIFRPDNAVLPFEDCPTAVCLRERRPAGGRIIVIERADGTRFHVLPYSAPLIDALGVLNGAITLLVDVTEQSLAQETQARLAAIVESSDDAIISRDLQGVVRTWNAGAEHIFGYRAEEMVGKLTSQLVPAHLLSEEKRLLDKLFRGERIEHYETVRLAKDGRLINISLTVSPIRDPAGRTVGTSKVARDITEQKRAEKNLLDADRRKNEFLAMLAHELRNPLAAISSAVSLLQTTDNEEQQRWGRDIIERQAGQLTRLIDELLDVSRITQGKIHLRKEPVEASALIDKAVETVQPLMKERRHRLVVSCCKEPLWMTADPARLEQVLVNLLTNAGKYTDPEGHIEVTVRREQTTLIIVVRDNGIGMSAETLSQAFELFAQKSPTLDRNNSGLGIGLTLVKTLVEMHGGSVEARSEGTGRGSEFILRLPLDETAGASPAPAVPATTVISGSSRRVLIVDDNRDAAEALAQLLEITGHRVQTVYDGLAALESAAAFQPDVVLLDIGLPGLNGYEVAKRLRQSPALTKTLLIAVSGYCQEKDCKRSREAGFDHHLAKPVDHRTLATLMTEKL